MGVTVKQLNRAAFRLERGKTGASQSPGWGISGSARTLTAGDGFSFINFPRKVSIGTKADNSIAGGGFPTLPRQTGISVETAFTESLRVTGIGARHYWVMGFENVPVPVAVFVLTAPSTEPVAGATYRDVSNNDFTFMRKETHTDGTIHYVFRADDTVVPTLSTGTLTKQAGTGDATLTFTDRAPIMYEHLYELESGPRHYVDFPVAERISGWSSGDKKNRMATIGLSNGVNDAIFPNSMCRSFALKSSAGNLVEATYEFVSHHEDRGDYDSETWSLASALQNPNYLLAHHNMRVQMGPSVSTLVDLGVTDLDLKLDIPYSMIQDTVSGLYYSEPVMEGKYGVDLNFTLSRHSADTYQAYRDAWTNVVSRISFRNGYLMKEILMEESTLGESGPDDSDVAQEPIKLLPGYSSVNHWASWLYGNTVVHPGLMYIRSRNFVSTNSMFAT